MTWPRSRRRRDYPLHRLSIDIPVEPYAPSTDQLDLYSQAPVGSMMSDGDAALAPPDASPAATAASSAIFTGGKPPPSAAGVTPKACRHRNSRLVVIP